MKDYEKNTMNARKKNGKRRRETGNVKSMCPATSEWVIPSSHSIFLERVCQKWWKCGKRKKGRERIKAETVWGNERVEEKTGKREKITWKEERNEKDKNISMSGGTFTVYRWYALLVTCVNANSKREI